MRTRPLRPVAIVAAACTAFVLMFNAQSPSASQHRARNARAAVTVGAPAARAGADFPAAWEQAAKRHGAWLYGRQARAEARRLERQREAAAARQRALQAQRGPSSQGGGSYSGSLQRLACSFGWSCAIVSCLISHESQWDPHAYNSSSGAAGLLQFLPFHYRGRFDPFDPVANLRYGWSLYRVNGWHPWKDFARYDCGW